MIYLLDTDILIFVIRSLKSARHHTDRQRILKVVDRCRHAQAAGNSVGLSALTISELEYGAQRSGRYESEISAVRKTLMPFEIYDYDAVSCPAYYGRIRHTLELQGSTIGSMDMLIAAHALALDATLVSNNLTHFKRVTGLEVVSWLEPA